MQTKASGKGPAQASAEARAPGYAASGDLFANASKFLGLAPAPPPASALPQGTAKPKPKPHCTQWGNDVYGDPICIAYSSG